MRLREVAERVDDAQRHHTKREHQQRERHAVEADDEPAVDDADPVLVDQELQCACVVVVEVDQQQYAQGSSDKRCAEGNRLMCRFFFFGRSHHYQSTDQRDKGNEGEAPIIKKSIHEYLDPQRTMMSRPASRVAPANMTVAYCWTWPVDQRRNSPPAPCDPRPAALTEPSMTPWSMYL